MVIGLPVWGSSIGRPIAVAADLLVGNGTFQHEHEVVELAARGLVERCHELIATV